MSASSSSSGLGPSGSSSQLLAVVLVRGWVGVTAPLQRTLLLLGLVRKNRCMVFQDTPSLRGMLQKVKDYITWGEITAEMYGKLLEQQGELWQGRETDRKGKYTYNYKEVNGKKYKTYFGMKSPRKGFGRKGIKVAYAAGGGLGYRGAAMNELLERMM